ncbi:MAG: hypothetical protein A3D31_13265 [Candidatus Fluviicola riflensis]|nr:MAG: hypothetical protein CHH17_17700 [Candidatus Fluviicola riflensis]OGS77948.1 MAG: hypothetical protein A3D31_13265 [Candidatus Fluviicola riflensis]OGS85013.1 MAG: hypothetical protein A2724_10200 [Fluviicola sp. RIFCSPHIGHO2_01_FULL_43_53]OGS89285.1 MAG: hypothetical protein A3E30_04505 [Fluviicola sp. RIFCSPHIGHO2_12_FULL_43_24]
MKKEELILCIKKSGDGRDIELDRLTLADALLFQELLASFTELLQNYDDASKFRLNVFKSSAAVKLEAEESFLKLVENDIDSAMNRKPIRTGALKKWQTLQQVISKSNYSFEFDIVSNGISRRSLISEFKSKPFPSPKKKRTRRIENLTFLFGKLESLDSKAQLHIMPYDKDYSVRINCISEAEARRARDFAYSDVYICAYRSHTPSGDSHEFVDVYPDKDEFKKIQSFYTSYQKLDGQERYSAFIDLNYEIMEKDTDLEIRLFEILKYIRLFDNSTAEEGQLFTILSSLKDYKSHPIIKQTYESLLLRFKSRTKRKTV